MDIDSDFCIYRGSEVFDHLNEKYGKDHCCNIITFNNLQARAIIKDVARVFEVPPGDVNVITKFVPNDPANPIKDFSVLRQIPEINAFFNAHAGIYEHCKRLFGLPRHHSQHPAGVCVTPMPITDLLPVCLAKPTSSGLVHNLSQFEKDQTEQAGAVKLDILKLTTISVLYEQIDTLNRNYGLNIKLTDIPLDDGPAWDLICSGDTLGIFQMESPIGKDVIAKVQPRDIEELSAVNAFVRPGTSGLDEYCLAKRDPSKIRKFHPKVDKLLAATKGGIIYQENVMELIALLLNVSFGKADIYRRALEKPNKGSNPKLVEEFRRLSVETGQTLGIPKSVCEVVRDTIVENCGYLFNKSHAVSYSYITYWTAWVKANYPVVFYCSLFNNEKVSKLPDCINEAKKHGITVLPPSISESHYPAVVADRDAGVIRMGLASIKGVGEKAVEALREFQPFVDLEDYLSRAKGKGSGKAVVEAAATIGALDELPLVVNNADLVDVDLSRFRVEHDVNANGDGVSKVFMNREQCAKWYEFYQLCKKPKTMANYCVPVDDIKGKYLDNYAEGDLVFEKAGGLVVPEDQLENFGLTVNAVESFKTRCKPKGIFKVVKPQRQLSKPVAAFVDNVAELANVNFDKVASYLRDMDLFEISFIVHPLESMMHAIDLVEEADDGHEVTVAGIVIRRVKRTSARGNVFWNIILQTPREKVKITVWDDMFKKNQSILADNSIVMCRGTKGFGGVTAAMFREVKFKRV